MISFLSSCGGIEQGMMQQLLTGKIRLVTQGKAEAAV